MADTGTALDNKNNDIPELRTVVVADTGQSNVSGLKLAYRESGPADAPALFLMHGIGSNSTGYRNQFSAFGDSFRVIAWDAPGYCGSSHFAMQAPQASDYADAVAALLDQLEIDKCHILGSSLGAIIAASFAARYPTRAQTLILVAPATGNQRLDSAERETLLRSRIDDLAEYGPDGLAALRGPALVSPDASEKVLAAAREVVAAINPRGYSQAAHMLANANIFEDVKEIDVPALILVGTNDKITPADTFAKPIHQAMHQAQIKILEGAGHLLKLEVPDQFNSLLREFLNEMARRP